MPLTSSCQESYTAREWDAETELNYHRARYYDPGQGRFISQDPLGLDAGDVNLYRYVGNSPLNYVDPSGLQNAPVSGGSSSSFVSGINYSIDLLTSLPGAIYDSMKDDRAHASAQGAFNTILDRLVQTATVGFVDPGLRNIPSLYGHEDAKQGGIGVGNATATTMDVVSLVYAGYHVGKRSTWPPSCSAWVKRG